MNVRVYLTITFCSLIVVSANLIDIMNIIMKNNPSLITAAAGDTISTVFFVQKKGRADEGVTLKASQIFVSLFPTKSNVRQL